MFQHEPDQDYAKGEGRLWGCGLHSNGGGYTRKPVVYWSDDNGGQWHGPELLHGPLYPGTDTGYGDLKRRTDHTFIVATYYTPKDHVDDCSKGKTVADAPDPAQAGYVPGIADLEQYTFGGVRAQCRIGFKNQDFSNGWHDLYSGSNVFHGPALSGQEWRLEIKMEAPVGASVPLIKTVTVSREE